MYENVVRRTFGNVLESVSKNLPVHNTSHGAVDVEMIIRSILEVFRCISVVKTIVTCNYI
jgi:hypothetical protein